MLVYRKLGDYVMKKVIISGILLTAIFCGINLSFADSQTDSQQQYIAKIQANGIKYTTRGFMQVIMNNNAKFTEDFILAGMDAKTSTWGKVPPAYAAIYSGSDKALEVLLNNGVDANAEIAGETPLMLAICRKQPKIVDVLISHGANVNQVSGNKKPLNYALKKKQIKIANSLLKAGAKADDDALVRAIKLKNSALKEAVLLHYSK